MNFLSYSFPSLMIFLKIQFLCLWRLFLLLLRLSPQGESSAFSLGIFFFIILFTILLYPLAICPGLFALFTHIHTHTLLFLKLRIVEELLFFFFSCLLFFEFPPHHLFSFFFFWSLAFSAQQIESVWWAQNGGKGNNTKRCEYNLCENENLKYLLS